MEVGLGKIYVISYLGGFLSPPERARSPVKSCSGCERNRLLLAHLFTQPANVLVLDEPTNDLDIETLELLEELLANYDAITGSHCVSSGLLVWFRHIRLRITLICHCILKDYLLICADDKTQAVDQVDSGTDGITGSGFAWATASGQDHAGKNYRGAISG